MVTTELLSAPTAVHGRRAACSQRCHARRASINCCASGHGAVCPCVSARQLAPGRRIDARRNRRGSRAVAVVLQGRLRRMSGRLGPPVSGRAATTRLLASAVALRSVELPGRCWCRHFGPASRHLPPASTGASSSSSPMAARRPLDVRAAVPAPAQYAPAGRQLRSPAPVCSSCTCRPAGACPNCRRAVLLYVAWPGVVVA